MGDLAVQSDTDVKDTKEIQILVAQQAINERDSRIQRFRLDIEDVHKIKILELEAKIKRAEEEKKMFEAKLMRLQSIPAETTG